MKEGIISEYSLGFLLLSQLNEADQELYKNFNLVVSDRWQQEIAETVFDAINQDADKMEQKRKQKPKYEESDENCESMLEVLNNCFAFTTTFFVYIEINVAIKRIYIYIYLN